MTTANRSLVSSSSSHVKQNRLLSASKQGKVEEVRRLLNLGEPVTQQDHKGNTALHYASKRGHYSVVQLLVQSGAPVDFLNHSGQSPMELSTQPETTKLLALAVVQKKEASSLLLPKKQIFLESTKSSSSSSYPLHLAAKEGNSKELLRLLDLGKKIDVRDSNGNTPLHLASMHGRLSTVELLVEKGASVQVRNTSKETPLDLAKRWGQSEVVDFLLKKHEQSVSSSSKVTLIQNNNSSTTAPSKDPEGQAYLQFEAAYEAGKAMDQILSLDKLAELRLEKKDYFGAAHLINGAIAVATRSRVEQGCIKPLYQKLMEIEQLFLTKELGLKAAKRSHPTYARKELKKIREGAALRLQQNKPIQEVQGFLTKGYKVLLCELIGECMGLLGKGRPKGFAVMGLGSMARDEMCPYSDVEFAFIVKDPTQQNLAYFRRLSKLLTLKMINIGETKHELIRSKRVNQVMQPAKSLAPTGFSMDIGGLCPEGKKGIYELIGSPRQLANFQTPKWLHKNESEIILVNAMTTVCYLMGDTSLVENYKEKIKSILNKKESFLSLTGGVRERRAIQLIQGYVSEFKPRLDQDKVALRGFDVKQELYRLLQTVISGLALYHGIRATSTSQRLRELQQKRVISKQGAARLQQVFFTLLRLRVETHLFYGTEKEILYHSKGITDQSTDDLYPITKEIQQEIIEAYKTLVPLHQRAERFVQGDKVAFANCSFFDEAVGTHDDQQRVNLNFDSAEQSAQVATALNPNDSSARTALGLVQHDLGKVKQALQNCQEALALLKQKHGSEAHPAVARGLNNLGQAYLSLGNYLKAIEYHEASLKMMRTIYGETKAHPDVAASLNNLGSAYRSLGNHPKTIEFYEASLKMRRAIYGETKAHPDVASGLNNLGLTYYALGKHSKALEYHESSLKMKRTIYGNKAHPDVAMSLMNLGETYRSLGERSKALEYHESSLKMKRTIYGSKAHPDIASSLNNLGLVHHALGNYSKALEYHESSLKMKRTIYGNKPHSDVTTSLNNLGLVCHALGNYSKALEYHESSLKMKRTIYGNKPHSDVASSMLVIGLVHIGKSDITNAQKYLLQSHDMFVQTVGVNHPQTQRLKQLIEITIASSSSSHVQLNRLLDASRQDKVGEVRRLLKLGASVKQRDYKGNTPLHCTSKQSSATISGLRTKKFSREQEIFGLKVAQGMWLAAKNSTSNPLLPKNQTHKKKVEVAAIRPSASPGLLHPLLLNQVTSLETPCDSDLRGWAYLALEEAYDSKSSIRQMISLLQSAEIEKGMGHWMRAAHYFNSALSLAETAKLGQQWKQLIAPQLIFLEQAFIQHALGFDCPLPSLDRLLKRRERLRSIRKQISNDLTKTAFSIEKMQATLSGTYEEILREIVKESIQIFKGEMPPFTLVALGSLARYEVCPRSDIEFFCLVEEESSEILQRFDALLRIVAFKTVNIGETEFGLIKPRRINGAMQEGVSFTRNGFHMDTATLSTNRDDVRLVGTAKSLAYYQTKEWLSKHDGEIILANAMTTVRVLMGKEARFKEYLTEIHQILSPLSLTSSSSSQQQQPSLNKLCIERALSLIEKDVQEFKPGLTMQKAKLRMFNVKQELYRLPQAIISALALYYQLKETNTIKRIRQLQEMKIFSEESANNLITAFRIVTELRVRCHLFYADELEVLYYSLNEADTQCTDLFVITPQITQRITRVYRTLIPLHQAAKEFLNGNVDAFRTSALLDTSVGSYDENLRASLQFEVALTTAERCIALDPNDPKARIHYSTAQSDLGQVADAIKQIKQTLRKLEEENKKHPDISQILTQLGNLEYMAMDFSSSITHLTQALARQRIRAQNKPHKDVVNLLEMAARSSRTPAIGQLASAMHHLVEAAKMNRALYGADSTAYARSLVLVAELYTEVGEGARALQQLKSAEAIIEKKTKSQVYPEIALLHDRIATVEQSLGHFEEARKRFKQAVDALRKLTRDRPHPAMAESLLHYGNFLLEINELPTAIDVLKSALQMLEEVHKGHPHLEVSEAWYQLGKAHQAYGDSKLANNHFSIARAIHKKILGKYRTLFGKRGDNYGTARSLDAIGWGSYLLGQPLDAIYSLEEALAMKKRLAADKKNQESATTHRLLGDAFMQGGRFVSEFLTRDGHDPRQFYQQAVNHYHDAYQETKHCTLMYSKTTPMHEETFTLLGLAYCRLGRTNRNHPITCKQQCSTGLSHLKHGFDLRKQRHQDKAHPDLANSFRSFAAACREIAASNATCTLITPVSQWIPNSNRPPMSLYASRKVSALYNATQYLQGALSIYQVWYCTKEHPAYADTLIELGEIYEKKGRLDPAAYANAISSYEQALQIYKKLYQGRDHIKIAFVLSSLGNASRKQAAAIRSTQGSNSSFEQLSEKAIAHLSKSWSMLHRLFGDDLHPLKSKINYRYGVALMQGGQFKESMRRATSKDSFSNDLLKRLHEFEKAHEMDKCIIS